MQADPGMTMLFGRRPHVVFVLTNDWEIVSTADDVVRRTPGGHWALCNVAVDRRERVDLADEHPERLRTMLKHWQACEDAHRGDSGIQA